MNWNSPLQPPRNADELVTVVVPARNEEAAIEDCLTSILRQSWHNLEVIVVDGRSTDGTVTVVREVAARDPRVRLLVNPRGTVPISLNLALQQASARWLVRVDAHATIPPDYVEGAVRHLRSAAWGAVGGRKDGIGRTAAGRAIARAMASRFGVGGSTYHWGTHARLVEHVPFGAYPVDLLRSIGGWDEALSVNQDFELDYRVRLSGHRILFDPALRIEWECRQSISALARQYRRYGSGKVLVARKHPRSLRPRHLAAPALVANIALSLFFALRRPLWAGAALAPYVALLSVATVKTARGLDADARRFVAPAFLAMHVGWGVGFWEGLGRVARARGRRVRGRRRVPVPRP